MRKFCSIFRDINYGVGGDCLSQMNAGIADYLYVYNLDDVEGLVFEDDSRPDDNLFIETIISSAPYYRINASDIVFNEEYEDGYYSIEITANINSISEDIEENLEAAVHGKYLVAGKLIGGDYVLFGWKEGLAMDENLTISKTDSHYEITFTGNTTYPKMVADESNFDLSNKVFEPIFEPLFDQNVICNGDGWAIAAYVTKVNAAGQALDSDNKLCQFSGKKQDAYKYNGVADGGYNILGTYNASATYNGKAVRVYDTSLCNVQGSITVNPTAITLNSSNPSGVITVNSTNDWELITYPSYVTISRTEGTTGTTTVNVTSNACGTETLTFRNRSTKGTASVTITSDRITMQSPVYLAAGTTSATFAPNTCGTYTATSDKGTVVVNSDGTFTISNIPTSEDTQTINVTLKKGSETKVVQVIVYGNNTSQHAKLISEWCEEI